MALLSRDSERPHRAAEGLAAYGIRALPVPTDVADAAAVEAAADKVETEPGAVDVWVNVTMMPSSRSHLLSRGLPYLHKASRSPLDPAVASSVRVVRSLVILARDERTETADCLGEESGNRPDNIGAATAVTNGGAKMGTTIPNPVRTSIVARWRWRLVELCDH